jgi:monofunctional biosynthetic peptidoglycan transglycosylase
MNNKLNLVRRLFHFGLGGLVLFVLVITGSIIYLWLTTPEVTWLQKTNPQETAMMQYRAEGLSHNDNSLQRRWKWVELSDISPDLVRAVIIVEDQTFYHHRGFDWKAIRRALNKNIEKKRIIRGGSTITQQLAKNIFLKPSRSLTRKIRETLITYYLEEALSKDRILELYLNVIEWGPEIYGIEAASQFYFRKSSGELSIAEAIRLASVLNNPHRFSPLIDNSRRMMQKRYQIAMVMLQTRAINFDEFYDVLAGLSIAFGEDGIVPFSRRDSRILRRLSDFRDPKKDTHYNR